MKKTFLAAMLIAVPCAAAAQAPRIEAEAGIATLLAIAKADYERANPRARAEAALVNSAAAALGKLCRGEIGVAGTGRAATPAERALCAQNRVELIEMAVATESVTLVVNPANTWAKQLGVAEMKRIWLEAPGKATSWRQVNAAYPDTPLKLYVRAPSSGSPPLRAPR